MQCRFECVPIFTLFQLALSKTWIVKQNLFLLLVAPRGAGKTPASQVFLGPLLDIEENEKREFHNINAKSRKKRKVDATPAIGVPSLETISEKLLGRQFSMALKTQL